jgi:hypothetical protein
MSKVFILWHVRPDFEEKGNEEDAKILGVFSSDEAARAWQQKATRLPGFCETPDSFVVDPYELDEPSWTEGFVTVMLPEE